MKRQTNKSRSLVLAGAILVSLCLSGCGKETQEPVEITIIHGWGSVENDHVTMREIYRDFEEENPDIKLRLISMPTTDEVVSKVEDMLTVGEVPDVIFTAGVGKESIYRYMVEQDLALDFMPYLEADPEFKKNIAPANLEGWTTEDGKLYSISDVLLLSGGYWYNEDIFEKAGISEPPADWDTFFADYERITEWAEQEQNGVEAMHIMDEGYLYLVDNMLAGLHGETEKQIDNRHMVINDREFLDVLDRLQPFYDYNKEAAASFSYRDETSLFNEGKLAMYLNGIWGASMISDNIHAKYVTLPTFDGESMSCISSCLGYLAGNTKDTQKMDASVRFVKYMLSEAVQKRILIETEQMPANPGIDIADYALSKPRFYQAVSEVENASKKIDTPETLWESEKKDLFQKHILEVLSGEINKVTFLNMLT